jgi:hypothetical protein
MGFEPRAAQRLRMAVESANGALDDIADLIANTAIAEEDGPVTDVNHKKSRGLPRGRTAA